MMNHLIEAKAAVQGALEIYRDDEDWKATLAEVETAIGEFAE